MNAAAYSASGTRFILFGRSEIALFRASRRARTRPYHHAAPRAVALRVLRRVADRVLARQLVGNLCVDAVQLGELVREKCPASGLLRHLAQDEFRFLEQLGSAAALVVPE